MPAPLFGTARPLRAFDPFELQLDCVHHHRPCLYLTATPAADLNADLSLERRALLSQLVCPLSHQELDKGLILLYLLLRIELVMLDLLKVLDFYSLFWLPLPLLRFRYKLRPQQILALSQPTERLFVSHVY